MVDSGCFLIHVCTDSGRGFPLISENPSQSVTHRKTTRSRHRIHTGRLLILAPLLLYCCFATIQYTHSYKSESIAKLNFYFLFFNDQLVISFIETIQRHFLTKGIQLIRLTNGNLHFVRLNRIQQ